MKICFLSSGNGGNFKFFDLSAKLSIVCNTELFLIADRECGALEYARKNRIYNKIIEYKRSYNEQLLKVLEEITPDIIITNWHKIIDAETVKKYYGKLINLHYSLLPAFGGLIGIEPIKQAYEKNCQYIGATCHYVDENVDSGKIISQAILKSNILMEDAIQKVFMKGCLILLNSILIIKDEEIIKKSYNEKFEFSPNLLFDDTIFDINFWRELSRL